MKQTKCRKILTILLSLIFIFTAVMHSTMAFLVTQTEPLINTFIPFQGIVNDLILTKTVEHPLGAGYVIPDHIGFDFEINLGSAYANATVSTTDGEKTADENGVITVMAKPDVPVAIEGIDEGTTVTVTELPYAGSGFAVKDGIASKETTISAEDTASVDFTNVYTPLEVQPVNLYLTGAKILDGRAWLEDDTFSFLLEQDLGNNNWVPLGTKTIAYDADDENFYQFDFNDIIQELTFDHIGTYKFRLSEIIGDLPETDYDHTVNEFRVIVTDKDMDGRLEIQDVTASQNGIVIKDETTGEFTVDILFTNTSAVLPPNPDDITVSIIADKTVRNTGTASIGPEDFNFVLENVNTGDKLALKSDADGLAIFDLTFSADDIGKTFGYTLSETDDGRDGVTYSTEVYDIAISIELSEDNTLQATVTCNGSVTDNCVAAFVNTYHKDAEPLPTPADISVPITAKKILAYTDSADLISPENFKFVLENTHTGYKLTRKSDANGLADFALTFSAADVGKTFHYTLSEIDDGRKNILYSTEVYEIAVSIGLSTDNKLTAAVTCDGKVTEECVASFTNLCYSDSSPLPAVDAIKVPITINKTVKNVGSTSIGPENFEFVLENIDTGVKQTLKSNKDGLAIFDLVFTQKDVGTTFCYKLTEINGGRDGVTYSNQAYDIKITIGLNAENKLTAAITCNGAETQNCVAAFENIYRSQEEVPPTGDSNASIVWLEMLTLAAMLSTVLLIGYVVIRRKQSNE